MELRIPDSDLETYNGFLDESREHLDSIEEKVLGLRAGADPEVVNVLFRALHTVKGIAGFLGLGDIQKLSHRLESVFDAVRQGKLAATEDVAISLLAGLDRLQDLIGALARGLDARARAPEGGWIVACEDPDYAGAYAALGVLLEPAPQAAPAASEEELITPEMRAAFLKEAEEILDATEQILLALEAEPGDRDALARAFRNIHSFKGNCGFFGYARLEQASHRLESVLDRSRAKDEPVPKPVLETALRCLDVFAAALPGGPDGDLPDPDGVMAALNALAEATAPLGEILVRDSQATPEAVAYALSLQNRPLGQILVEEGLAAPAAVARALEQQQAASAAALPKPAAEPARAPQKEAKRDLRVDLSKLDHLMDLVGELVISTGMVFNHPALRGSNDPDLERVSHQLKGVVSELQAVALGVRMIPVEGAFRKMTRLVHDLSSKVGKQVKLEFRGAETEVDKTVVDLIADPLVHMIRNSIDHGLEPAPERAAAGKDPCGTVLLEAGQEGGEILITVGDDGRGLNRERILRKALERNLVEGDPAALLDEDVFQFIFQPGFSTAEAVTSTSGRGVGMDVVKSNIDRLGGRIQIKSQPGQGSRITMRIPLTLSILEGMMVEVGGSLFILPLTAVRESLAPRRENLRTLADGQEIYMLRGKALPIVRLSRLLRLHGGREDLSQGLLIHVAARDRRFCIAVDNLIGQRQTVVKALPGMMGQVPGISSCSILDDGAIALILDVAGVAELAGGTSGRGEAEAAPEERRAA